MKATILKIIRNGLQGDKDAVKSYTKLLAVCYENQGDEKFAQTLLKYADENFGNEIKPMQNISHRDFEGIYLGGDTRK